VKIAALQLSSQGMSSTKFYNYLRIASKNGVKVLLLGEYILNPFFKELAGLSVDLISEQASFQSRVLQELSELYGITIVAPLLRVKRGKIYKSVAKFSTDSTRYYDQQILINYPHWNEESYFANEVAPLKRVPTFVVDGVKFAIVSGFELHFDEIFANLKGVHCILAPSVSTFESYKRWEALLLTRAFTHNCYILRANRIGEYRDADEVWSFYGDSILASPHGELLEHLGNKEELLIGEIDRAEVTYARRSWRFAQAIKRRQDA